VRVVLHRGRQWFLSLPTTADESDLEEINEVRRHHAPPITEEESKYLVYFHIEGVRPLIGI